MNNLLGKYTNSASSALVTNGVAEWNANPQKSEQPVTSATLTPKSGG